MSAPAAARPFLDATAVARLGPGLYAGGCDPSWSAPQGPNGGYLAAIVLRALMAEVDEPARAPRSLTLHYLRPPQAGPLTIAVSTERAGRTVSTLSFRLEQDGRPCVLGIAGFSLDQDAVVDYDAPMPAAPAPEAVRAVEPVEGMPPIAHRVEARHCLGERPFSGADEARTGGWLALRDDALPLDAPLLALYVDAWIPASFPRLTAPLAAPTMDLTIHFRAPLPPEDDEGTGRVLLVATSAHAERGLCDEDILVFSPSGRLLAQSRQLALLRAVG